MSKYDAERALSIYKTFTKQTNLVVEFLSTARQYENATRLEIPKLKHAPTSLTSSLQEYLNDPDFEINRRQYLAQQEAKKGGKGTSNGAATAKNNFTKSAVNSGGTTMEVSESKTVQTLPPKQETKGPAPDLIDFFGSIEQNQQTMASAPQQPQQQQVPNFGMGQHYQQQQQLQQTGVVPQQLASYFSFEQNGQPQQTQNVTGSTNPFGQPQQQPQQQPVQQDFAGTGFSGYAQQPFNQQPDPFSTISQSFSSQLPQTQQQQQQQQSFNTGQPQNNSGQQPFGTQKQPVFSQQPQQPMVTGTNPFRQSTMPQATGASQSAFSIPTSPQSYQTTGSNPFARNISNQHTSQSQNSPFAAQQGSPFTSPPPQEPQGIPFNSPPQSQQQQQQQQQNASQPMTPMRTGTNPFAPNRSVTMPVSQLQPTTSPLVPTQTGSTNPFRKSEFLNQQTGQGWQAGQGTIGGFEQLPTMPVFPRLGQPQQGQQQGTWP
ncbi:hypothetical protein MMC21_006869 [Puttea exsequens]|nr:hypothetical protein [Puttea exsequens]